MPRPRNEIQAKEMQRLYSLGYSLAQVGTALGVTRQNVYKILKRRNAVLRRILPAPYVQWNGRKFSLRENGYYADTTDSREYLHRAVWEYHYGDIPEGYEVHHKDEDKTNNSPSNLQILTSAEHGAAHGFGGNQYVPSLGRRPVK